MKLFEAQALTQDNEIAAHVKRQLELEAELHSAEVKLQMEVKTVKAESEENFSRVKVKLEKEISKSKKYESELALTKKDLDRLRQNMKEQRTENLHTTEKIIQQTIVLCRFQIQSRACATRFPFCSTGRYYLFEELGRF